MIRTGTSSCVLLLGCWCLCGLFAAPALAQSGGMFGSNSPSNRAASGMSSMGGNNFGGMSGSMGGMGSAFGGMGGGLGSSGFGANGLTGGANRGATGLNANRLGAQGANQGNFIGRNANANQFIGGNPNTQGGNTANRGQQNTRRQGAGQGNRNSNNNDFQNELGNRSASTSNQAIPLRAQQKISFEVPRPQLSRRQSQLQTRFSKLTERNAGMKGITVVTDEAGATVLQGEVPSAAAAKLAEKLIRLEPGVSSVRSELTYPGAAGE